MATFGYARVSTRDQDLASQVAALLATGCGNVFKEKASGAKTDRPELAKAIRRLEAGDVLVVTRLDRLAREAEAQAQGLPYVLVPRQLSREEWEKKYRSSGGRR